VVGLRNQRGWGLGEFWQFATTRSTFSLWLPAKLVGIRNSIMKKSFMGKGGFNLGLRGIYIYKYVRHVYAHCHCLIK
jgi:hypothetical protein